MNGMIKRVQAVFDIVVHRIVWKKGGAMDKVDCTETIGGGIFSWKGCAKIKTLFIIHTEV